MEIVIRNIANEFIVINSDKKATVELADGSYIIVPKGIWHTAKTTIKSKILFITPGEGTLNKPEPE